MKLKATRRFIIGGGDIYRQFLPKAEKLYLTEIEAECPDAMHISLRLIRLNIKKSFLQAIMTKAYISPTYAIQK